MQTTYAELLQRCAATAFSDAFPEDGTFIPKTIKGKRYWYFQQSSDDGRAQKYVGPETPQLLEQISNHKIAADIDYAGNCPKRDHAVGYEFGDADDTHLGCATIPCNARGYPFDQLYLWF
jgi:hypothetical protein